MSTRIATALVSALGLWFTASPTFGAAPTVTTLGATNITTSSATVNGQVNPNGAATTAYFELGTTTNYDRKTPNIDLGGGNLPFSLNASFFGLSPATLYHYRVVGQNSSGTNYGADLTLTTLTATGAAPTVTTLGATNITTSSAKINGQVNPNGAATTAYFELGPTTNYDRRTPNLDLGSGTLPFSLNADFFGLSPATLYHYRVVGQNSVGTNYGADLTFTTLAGTGGPSLNINLLAGQVVVSWSLISGAGTLQSNTNLASNASWVTVSPAPVVTGNQYVVTNNATAAAQFYRLKLP